MRKILLLLFFPLCAWGDVNGDFSSDGDSGNFQLGPDGAVVYLGDLNSSNFGTGIVSVECYDGTGNVALDDNWYRSGTSWSSAIVESIDAIRNTLCRLSLDGSTNPDLGYHVDNE